MNIISKGGKKKTKRRRSKKEDLEEIIKNNVIYIYRMSGSITEFTKWLGSPAGRKVVQQVMDETNLRPEKYNKDINDV